MQTPVYTPDYDSIYGFQKAGVCCRMKRRSLPVCPFFECRLEVKRAHNGEADALEAQPPAG